MASTRVLMKRVVPLATALALVGGSTAPVEARPQQVKGSFVASAKPMPAPWFVPAVDGCAKGLEGVHKVTHPLVAPFSGWLKVNMTFEGDWDLSLVDADGERLASSEYQWWWDTRPIERLTYFLNEGDEVGIVACNFASHTDAKVRYSLTAGTAWGKTTPPKVSRLEELIYSSPAAATTVSYGICHVGTGLGCTATTPASTDRFVSVEILDDFSPTVAFELYQFHGSTYLKTEEFCGSSNGKVPLLPRADWVGVVLFAGPCGDGTAAMATKGKALMRFTSF